MKTYQVVILVCIVAAFAGFFFGKIGTPRWVDFLVAWILAAAGTRIIQIWEHRSVSE
jgi:hypothetical protein